ncbi:MAG: LPS assembly lipoprotein LptE, partial [Quisquiliibacterium sp.]
APGCGFQLKQAPKFSFERLFISAPYRSQAIGEFRRQLRANPGLQLVDKAEAAQVRLDISRELREKEVISFSTAGRPREYQLRLRVKYQVTDAKGRELIGASELVQRREVSIGDTDLLAKEYEDQLMYREMQSDIVQQLMSRLAALRL